MRHVAAGAFVIALMLLLGATDSGSVGASSSSVPTSEQARIVMGRGVFWYHTCPGDYNQDGLVNASDITPLGANLDESALPDAFAKSTHFSLIDGDQNGMLTIADMTAIGANFESDVLGGYHVYAADSLGEYPDTNAAPSKPGAHLMGSVALADTLTADDETVNYADRKVRARKRFSFATEYPLEHRYWWVRPVDKHGNEGTPSEVVVDPGSHVPRNDLSAAVASWDPAPSTLSWYSYNHGDYNCDGDVGVADMTPVLQNYMQSASSDVNSVKYIADGDFSRVIDDDDIDIIGQYFGLFIAGYSIYASDIQSVYPQSNDVLSVVEPVSTIHYERSDYDDQPQYRPLLSVELPEVTAGTYLWVRPYDYVGYEGTPSNLVVAE